MPMPPFRFSLPPAVAGVLVAAALLAGPRALSQEPGEETPPPQKLPPEAVLPETEAPAIPTPDETPTEEKPPPAESSLIWWNRPIIVFRSTTAQQTPAARQADALKRIEAAADRLLESEVTTKPAEVEDESGFRFMIGEDFLFTLLESDLDQLAGEELGASRDQILANLGGIRQARLEQGSAEAIARGVTAVVVATVVTFLVLLLLRFVARFLAARLEHIVSRWKRLKLARADLRPHVATLVEQFVKAAAVLLALYLCSCWIAFSLNQFPLTEPLGSAFTARLKILAANILGTVFGALPGLVCAAIILLLARWLARVTDRVIRSMGRRDDASIMSEDTAKATRRIAMVMIWLFGIVLAYPYLPGSGSDAFKGVSLLIGLMVSLGSSGMINQVMSGFVLLYSGSVRTGEYVRIGETEGTVTEMGILAIKILTPQKEFLTIPNAVVVGNPSTNYSRLSEDTGVPVVVPVTIGYDAPWRQVHQLLIDAARKTEGILEQPEPRVVQKSLSDWYAEYVLTCYTGEPEGRTGVLSRLNGQIQDVFNEAGVQIMSPHYRDDKAQPLIIPRDRWFPPSAPGPPPSSTP